MGLILILQQLGDREVPQNPSRHLCLSLTAQTTVPGSHNGAPAPLVSSSPGLIHIACERSREEGGTLTKTEGGTLTKTLSDLLKESEKMLPVVSKTCLHLYKQIETCRRQRK